MDFNRKFRFFPTKEEGRTFKQNDQENCLCSGWVLHIAVPLLPRPCFADPILEC